MLDIVIFYTCLYYRLMSSNQYENNEYMRVYRYSLSYYSDMAHSGTSSTVEKMSYIACGYPTYRNTLPACIIILAEDDDDDDDNDDSFCR